MLARSFEQDKGSERVCADEGVGFGDRAVNVRLGSEVDYCVDAGDRVGHGGWILNRAVDEAVVNVLQVLLATGVGELVEHRYFVAVFGYARTDEVGADKSCATADQKFHLSTLRRACGRVDYARCGEVAAEPFVPVWQDYCLAATFASQHAEGRTRGGAGERLGCRRLDLAAKARKRDRFARQVEPAAAPAADGVEDSGFVGRRAGN